MTFIVTIPAPATGPAHDSDITRIVVDMEVNLGGQLVSIAPIMGSVPPHSMSNRPAGELYVKDYLCVFRK